MKTIFQALEKNGASFPGLGTFHGETFQPLEKSHSPLSNPWKTLRTGVGLLCAGSETRPTGSEHPTSKGCRPGLRPGASIVPFDWRATLRRGRRGLPVRRVEAVRAAAGPSGEAGRWAAWFGLLLIVLATGCATPEMKGTPFYTGEYARRVGPAEERVNAWPLFYYRNPALSVLWPIFEHTDTHLAVRPIYSVYGTDRSNQQYNVLWPLAQFDRQTKDYRIFPVFWGGGLRPTEDYRAVFPLYWHRGHPLADEVGGLDALFPFWSLSRYGTNSSSFYCPWPLVRVMHEGQKSGWHVFPVAGSYGDGNKYFRFQAAFLADQWGNERQDRHGSLVLPLYFFERQQDAWSFYSLPWSGGQAGDTRWQFILPLLGYHRTNTTGSLTLSPLWLQSQAANPAEGGWAALLPLLYYGHGAEGSTTLSPLWLAHSAADPQQKSWQALLPVFFHSSSTNADLLLTPLWSQGASSNATWQCLLPLYYARQEGADKFWATPLGGMRTADGQQSWMIYPLLSWGTPRADGGEFWALAPLIHADWNASNAVSHAFPFYYHNSATRTFLSPAWARWTGEGCTNSVVPPLLSWLSTDAGSSDLFVALGLGKFCWGPQSGSQWLLPVFFHDRKQQTFLSPVFAQWGGDSSRKTVIPPLLSWMDTQPERSDFHLGLCLGNFSSGARPGAQWLIPFFYHDRADQTFLSPLWARWPASGGGTNTCLPFTLSWMTEAEKRNDFWLLFGLGKFSWGEQPGASHLLPFYYHDPQTRAFYSLIYGRKPDDFTYFATPLVGQREGQQAGSWCFPLYSHKRDTRTDEVDDWYLWANHWERNGVSRSVMFPLFGYHNFGPRDGAPKAHQRWAHFGKDFFCLPICWYKNETFVRPSQEEIRQTYAARKNKTPPPQLPLVRENKYSHGCFPLWSYSSMEQEGAHRANVDGSLLLWLYDYTRAVQPPAQAAAGANDYTRARVLWRLWHYERLNGEVSVDVFPGFTFDRKNDGFKKFSWLWRFFRYERDKDGGKKLDLLFIPLLRSGGKSN